MGGVASAIGNALGEVGHAVESVGKIAESAVREVGHAAESVGREIGKIGEAAAKNPIGTIAKVAAVASGQWWALPLVSAVDVVAHGGDIGQAALAAGVSVAASWAGGAIASELAAPAADSVATMATQDAASMVAQNIPADQISQVLQQSYGISGNIADSIANASAAGISANTLASSYAGAFGQQLTGAADAFSERLASTAIGNSAANFGAKLVQTGGDVGKALAAGAGAGIGTGFGGMVSNELANAGVNSAVATAAGKVVGGTTAGVVQGQDINKAISSNLVQNIISTSFAQAGSQLKSAWNSVNETATKYNETAQSAQDLLKNEVEPARDAAQAAQDAAAASYKEYKSKSDEFADLVKQYDDAKAAGNTTLANELADKANALIPSLNDATDKYNTDAETYQSALDKFNAGNAKLESTGKQLEEIKTTYQQQNDVLNKQTEELSTAAAKVAELNNPNAVKLFNDTYATGADATTALNNATDYSKLSSTARGAFDRDYTSTGDMKSSFDFANKINELDTKSQSAFDVAIKQGLDNTKAFEVAPVISNFNANQQTAYADAIKQGYGSQAADFMSALASFGNKALDTIIPSAQAGELPYVGKTPEGKDLVESVYRQDPTTGKWGEYIPDGKGGYTNTGAVLVGDYSTGPSGYKYVIDNSVDANGVPSMSMTPYAGDVKPNTTVPAQSTKEQLDSELASGQITKEEYDNAIKNVATTPNTSAPSANIPTSTDVSGTPVIGSTTSPATPMPIMTGTKPGFGNAGSTATGDGTFAGTNVGPSLETGNQTTPGTGSGGTGGTGAGGNGSGGTGTGGTGSGGTGSGGTGIGGGSALVGTGGYGTWLAQQGQDQYGGIKNLTPGLTERMDYTLTGMPTIQEALNPTTEVPRFAAGGSSAYDPFGTGSDVSSGLSKSLTPGLTKAQIQYILSGLPGANISVQGHADGGSIEEHNPTFFSEGGLNAIENRYVQGDGDGTSDSVKAMLANGEFVIPADVVSDLGNGSNEAGASILDQFLVAIRQDKHPGSDGKLPKDSKGPLAYLLDAKRNAKA